MTIARVPAQAEEDRPRVGLGTVSSAEAGIHAATKWARQDSNLGPTDYESAALTAELRAPLGQA